VVGKNHEDPHYATFPSLLLLFNFQNHCEQVQAPVKKCFGFPREGGLAKNLYTKSD